MPALSFKSSFAEKILSEAKTTTIRVARKVPIEKGDTLYLFSGMRTKNCKRIATAVCMMVEPVTIDLLLWEIYLGVGQLVLPHQLTKFAQDDGFENAPSLFQWFTDQYGRTTVFRGDRIHFALVATAERCQTGVQK